MFFLKELPSQQMVERYTENHSAYGAETVLAALNLMRRGSELIRNVDQYFSAQDFSQLRFLVLIVIDREPERDWLYVSEIANKLDVSKAVMARTVKSLTAAGLLACAADEEDGRAKRLSLTPAGHQRLAALLPGYFDILGGFMTAVDR